MKIEFVDDARRLYKRWSIQFSVFAAALLAYAAANPQPVLDLLNQLPEGWPRSLAVFVVSFGIPATLSSLKQPTKGAPNAD